MHIEGKVMILDFVFCVTFDFIPHETHGRGDIILLKFQVDFVN